MRRFEFTGGSSSKYWEVSQSGTQVTVHFGRIGSDGQTQTKDYGSWEDAAERVRKLVVEKLREGYVEVEGLGSRPEDEPAVRQPSAMPPYEVPALPEDGPLAIGNVQLPAGRRLRGDPKYAPRQVGTVEQPVIWATTAPVDFAGRSLYWLRQDAAALNLVPVLLTGLEEDDPGRPWNSGEFCPTDPRRAALIDVQQELAHAWSASVEGAAEDEEANLTPVRPFGKAFPGLASPSTSWRDIKSDGDVLDEIRGRRVALVAAERPADVVAAVGWMGAVNVHEDPALLSAVLRSWEVRWYARLVEMGFATITLTVGNPPRDERSALALAAEHFAFCPDNIWQGRPGIETIAAYAPGLIGSRTWRFWWD
ncbi:MAG TPA: DUF4253 domain-containing protein [Candidatus Dormibacteraeota bacterium]|nr:DUF4253 domain-containing protein [Candidatus Dormibacteraeota bacterium]